MYSSGDYYYYYMYSSNSVCWPGRPAHGAPPPRFPARDLHTAIVQKNTDAPSTSVLLVYLSHFAHILDILCSAWALHEKDFASIRCNLYPPTDHAGSIDIVG